MMIMINGGEYMKQIYIDYVVDGMVLARNIIDENDNILLKRGTTLTTSLAQKLSSLGFTLICVEDKKTNDIDIDDCISYEKRKEIIDSLKNLNLADKVVDYSKVTANAVDIIQSVARHKNIAFDLLDIRNDKNYDFNHALGVAELSVAIALEYRNKAGDQIFDMEKLESIAQAGLLHEIGKRCRDSNIAKKLKIKNYDENDELLYGAGLLKDSIISNRATITTSILFSQTDMSGNGAPKQFESFAKNKGVYVGARILYIADYYNSLISNKIDGYYNLSPAGAAEVILANSDILFDHDLVQTFISRVAIFPIGCTVKLSNGELAIVIKNNLGDGKFNYRPIVRTEDNVVYDLMECQNLTIIKTNTEVDMDYSPLKK